ncbi:hypothetical protein V7183_25735, partial [Bacillus sp. JJ1127]|uniref:hypothetical protein n=1 Tax=Bacillus sp. JJ1127 TaxID=3122952 RepID=UPI002FFF0875
NIDSNPYFGKAATIFFATSCFSAKQKYTFNPPYKRYRIFIIRSLFLEDDPTDINYFKIVPLI